MKYKVRFLCPFDEESPIDIKTTEIGIDIMELVAKKIDAPTEDIHNTLASSVKGIRIECPIMYLSLEKVELIKKYFKQNNTLTVIVPPASMNVFCVRRLSVSRNLDTLEILDTKIEYDYTLLE